MNVRETDYQTSYGEEIQFDLERPVDHIALFYPENKDGTIAKRPTELRITEEEGVQTIFTIRGN